MWVGRQLLLRDSYVSRDRVTRASPDCSLSPCYCELLRGSCYCSQPHRTLHVTAYRRNMKVR